MQSVMAFCATGTAVLGAFCCSSFTSYAQEEPGRTDTVYQLSPVIVTPTHAIERLSPVTFSQLSAATVRDRYSVQDIPVLLSELPSITSYSENGNGIGYNYVNLRGFDQRRISIMVNGVPQNDPEDHNVYWIDLPDLLASTGEIQVQRGAGSSFYGPPAIGGSINIVTNPFDAQPGVLLETVMGLQEFGDSSGSLVLTTKKYSAGVNSGLIDKRYMVYGRLSHIESDGYRHNSWVDFDSYFLGAIRFDQGMTTRFHVFGGPIGDGLAYYGLPKFVNDDKVLRRQNLVYWEPDSAGSAYSYAIPRRPQEQEHFSQPHYELLHDWELTDELTLHNTLFLYTGDGFFDYDASWADTSMLRIGYTYGIPATDNPTNTLVRATVSNRQWGWLPRITLEHAGGELTAGGELRFHRSDHYGTIRFAEGLPPGYDPDYRFYEYNGERDIIAAFVHELFRPTDRVSVMADLQLVHNRYAIAGEKYLGNNFSLNYLFLNPRVGINFNATETLNGYLSMAYTSREPRMRNLYAAEDSWFGATPQFAGDIVNGAVQYDFTRPLAAPEHLFNVELGGGFHSTDVRAHLTLFLMEFSDELVKSGQVDIFGQPVTGNADRTRHIGVELDGVLRLTDDLTISGNATLSQNRLVRYRVIDDGGSPVTLDGNPIAGFPDALANLRLAYRINSLNIAASMKYVGPFYTDNFRNAANRNDAYTIFGLESLYTTPEVAGIAFSIRGEVRNLFNALYFTSGEGNAFFPAAERNYIIGISARL